MQEPVPCQELVPNLLEPTPGLICAEGTVHWFPVSLLEGGYESLGLPTASLKVSHWCVALEVVPLQEPQHVLCLGQQQCLQEPHNTFSLASIAGGCRTQ